MDDSLFTCIRSCWIHRCIGVGGQATSKHAQPLRHVGALCLKGWLLLRPHYRSWKNDSTDQITSVVLPLLGREQIEQLEERFLCHASSYQNSSFLAITYAAAHQSVGKQVKSSRFPSLEGPIIPCLSQKIPFLFCIPLVFLMGWTPIIKNRTDGEEHTHSLDPTGHHES